jgi:hypothetical protein
MPQDRQQESRLAPIGCGSGIMRPKRDPRGGRHGKGSEREPTPKRCLAPSAGPMVRILFPPAASLLRTVQITGLALRSCAEINVVTRSGTGSRFGAASQSERAVTPQRLQRRRSRR